MVSVDNNLIRVSIDIMHSSVIIKQAKIIVRIIKIMTINNNYVWVAIITSIKLIIIGNQLTKLHCHY